MLEPLERKFKPPPIRVLTRSSDLLDDTMKPAEASFCSYLTLIDTMEAFNFDDKLVEMQRKLFLYARSLTGNDETAKDIVGETNYRLLQNKEKFENRTYHMGVVYKILKNEFISHIRKTRRNEEKVVYFNESQQHDLKKNKSDNNYDLYDIEFILNTINQLDHDKKKVVELLMDDKSYEEICETLHLKMGTTKSRIHNIRNHLRILLKDFF